MSKSKYEKKDLVASPSPTQIGTLESILIKGDLSLLTQDQRLEYVNKLCTNLGLSPFTRPFDYLELNKKLVLYVNKSACDQLRSIHKISITKIEKLKEDDILWVTVYAQDANGRTDAATGAISLLRTTDKNVWIDGSHVTIAKVGDPLTGDDLINAHLKAETKAKRRVTLSIGGLGLLTEDDIELMPMEDVTPPEVLEKTEKDCQQIMESSQKINKACYKVDDKFMNKDEIEFLMKQRIERISNRQDMDEYIDWKTSNMDGLKAFCRDNKDIWMDFISILQDKENRFENQS